MNIMFLSKVRSLPVYPVTVMTCIRKDNSIKWLKWYEFLTFQLWLSNFVQGAIFLVFTHMMTWPCWCTKQRQNVANVLQNDRIIPKRLVSLLFCTPTWQRWRHMKNENTEHACEDNAIWVNSNFLTILRHWLTLSSNGTGRWRGLDGANIVFANNTSFSQCAVTIFLPSDSAWKTLSHHYFFLQFTLYIIILWQHNSLHIRSYLTVWCKKHEQERKNFCCTAIIAGSVTKTLKETSVKLRNKINIVIGCSVFDSVSLYKFFS